MAWARARAEPDVTPSHPEPAVLAVSDAPASLEPVVRALQDSGLRVDVAAGPAALAGHALVLVDDAVEMGVVELCRALRGRSDVPIIVLSASGDEDGVVAALDAGADDVVTLPAGARELAARARAAIRRGAKPQPPREPAEEAIVVGNVRLDPTAGYVATVAGERVDLTRKEFELLRLLMINAGQIVPRRVLIERIWGSESTEWKTLDTHIRRLRAKVEPNPSRPSRIVTFRNLGYRYNRPRR